MSTSGASDLDPFQGELLRRAEAYLGEYLGKIRDCVLRLSEEQVWWRPNPASNSVGNLLLHLCGNLTQWVLCGLGDLPDQRRRAEEFTADRTRSRAELLQALESVVARCQSTIASLGAADLASSRMVQGKDRTVLEAVVHPVEHMSYHTGQIVYVAKMLAGEQAEIDFYPHLKR